MKLKFTNTGFAVAAIAAITVSFPDISQARPSTGTYFCGINQEGILATLFAHPQRGDIPIIIWKTTYFEASGYSPQTRCKVVSQRFEEAKKQGVMNFVVPSRKNGYEVVCAAKERNSGCDKMLYTVEPNMSAQASILEIKKVNESYGDPFINQPPAFPKNDKGETVMDVSAWLTNFNPERSCNPGFAGFCTDN